MTTRPVGNWEEAAVGTTSPVGKHELDQDNLNSLYLQSGTSAELDDLIDKLGMAGYASDTKVLKRNDGSIMIPLEFISIGLDASKPTASDSNNGQVYWATDTKKLYFIINGTIYNLDGNAAAASIAFDGDVDVNAEISNLVVLQGSDFYRLNTTNLIEIINGYNERENVIGEYTRISDGFNSVVTTAGQYRFNGAQSKIRIYPRTTQLDNFNDFWITGLLLKVEDSANNEYIIKLTDGVGYASDNFTANYEVISGSPISVSTAADISFMGRLVHWDSVENTITNSSDKIPSSAAVRDYVGNEATEFNIDSISQSLTTLADSDKFVVADVSASNQPNKIITLLNLISRIRSGMAVATTTVKGLLSSSDKSKLNSIATGAKPFNVHDDLGTELTSLHDDDRVPISDESAAGDPNRYTTLDRLKNFIQSTVSAFDLHDDVTTELTSLNDLDRLLASDESTNGDPNRYITLDRLKDWIITFVPSVTSFNLHDDVSNELTNPVNTDRILASDESAAGDPNRWLSLTRLTTFLNGVLSLNASRITAGILNASRLPNASKTAEGVVELASDTELDTGTDNSNKVPNVLGTQRMINSSTSTGFNLLNDVADELIGPSTSDRLLVSDEGSAGDPNTWLSLSGLRNWLQTTITLNTSRITAGLLNASRLPNASKTAEGVVELADNNELDTGTDDTNKVPNVLGTQRMIDSSVTTGFDLHDDVTDELTNPANADRLIVSDEGSTGDPNKWLSLTRLTIFLNGVLSLNASRITAGILSASRLPNASETAEGVVELGSNAELDAGTDNTNKVPNILGTKRMIDASVTVGFNLHDDVSDELTNPANADRLLVSNEGTTGTPNTWLSLTRLITFFNTSLSLNASRITDGTLGILRIPNLSADKITSDILSDSRISSNIARTSDIPDGISSIADISDITISTAAPTGAANENALWIRF